MHYENNMIKFKNMNQLSCSLLIIKSYLDDDNLFNLIKF